ncbi:hypothetical protein OK18_11600 [Chryseobacterium gallinarum]|uniref:DUF3871 family protein n=1 Tax=Chryseobacterium gallinarum TaxID=1324352 RepID=A0A0G3M7Z0_CHRGL|nr:DUF3871 family protein [Chryseobacterium gallinarum]AKK73177.1 hypothetical protein OK18_11600 [Chryseobacterium gallinarum]
MDTINKIRPATLEEAFDLKPAKSANIIELKSVNIFDSSDIDNNDGVIFSQNSIYKNKPFIEANTQEIDLYQLKNDCIIPVFSKDNEKTIAHQEFIDITQDCISKVFSHQSFMQPEIRVSHQIKGRTPDAIYKNAKDLLDHERTQYFERMAFIIRIPGITDSINGNELSLTIGGVRAYNQENLYNKKTFEKFKFFIGFQNKVCCNLCVWNDGFVDDMRVSSYQELHGKIMNTLTEYNAQQYLLEMKEFSDYYLTEHQFAQLLGRTRLYQHISKTEKQRLNIPQLTFNDSQLNTIAKDYYEDESFCKDDNGEINLWNVYNLFTQANKSSYIDTFLDRNLNAFEFNKGIQKTLNGNSDYHWFLS